jgi:uncharacterized protein YjiS (DUF1127 family)
MLAIRLEDMRRRFQRSGASYVLGGGIVRVHSKFAAWRRRARDRERLAKLDNRVLADIGISRAEAEFLVNKPFWRE